MEHFIRTVLGDISPSELGCCDSHDHVATGDSHATRTFPDMLLGDVPVIAGELRARQREGLSAIIDCTPVDCGRVPIVLERLARETGVHIVMSTGCHMEKYYPVGWIEQFKGAHKLAEKLISDVKLGDEGVKAGVVKAASSGGELSAFELTTFAAAAECHKQTGAPVLTHTEQGRGGHEQLDFLEKEGVSAKSVILCHTDRVSNVSYHRSLLERGAYLEFDAFFRWTPEEINKSSLLLGQLYEDFPTQLLVGLDAARQTYRMEYGGAPGLRYFTVTLRALIRDLFGRQGWEQLTVENPAHAFRFKQ